MIKNIIILDSIGEFDYAVEGIEVNIIDVYEDAIEYVNAAGQVVTENCRFEGENAIIEFDDVMELTADDLHDYELKFLD